MTADQVITECRDLGITLEVSGNRLLFSDPEHAMTDPLRKALSETDVKEALRLRLDPGVVLLRGLNGRSVSMPVTVIRLLMELQAEGFELRRVTRDRVDVEPRDQMNPRQWALVGQWQPELSWLLVNDNHLSRAT